MFIFLLTHYRRYSLLLYFPFRFHFFPIYTNSSFVSFTMPLFLASLLVFCSSPSQFSPFINLLLSSLFTIILPSAFPLPFLIYFFSRVHQFSSFVLFCVVPSLIRHLAAQQTCLSSFTSVCLCVSLLILFVLCTLLFSFVFYSLLLSPCFCSSSFLYFFSFFLL